MLTINAIIRKNCGKSTSRRLRLINKIPAIIYGGMKTPVAIELNQDIILNIQIKEEFYTNVLNILLNGKENKVKIQAVQRHPFKPKIIHIDFIRV